MTRSGSGANQTLRWQITTSIPTSSFITCWLSFLQTVYNSYIGRTLSTGFGSESASRCSDVCTRWLLNTCRPTANPAPAFLVVATCDRLTVVISTRLPTCETCFVRRVFICIRQPFKLELTSCSP